MTGANGEASGEEVAYTITYLEMTERPGGRSRRCRSPRRCR